MKYKADYKNKMSFFEVISKFNTDSKYIACTHNTMITNDKIFETKIISFNLLGEIFIDGKFNDTGAYQELIKLDWYQVYQIPEVQKPPIDPNRKIAKGGIVEIEPKPKESYVTKDDLLKFTKTVDVGIMISTENGNILVKNNLGDELNLTEEFRKIAIEEIAKSEKQIKLLTDIKKTLNFAETVVSTANKISKEQSDQLLKSINQKPSKQLLKESLENLRKLNEQAEDARKKHNRLEAELSRESKGLNIDEFMETELYINGIEPNKPKKPKQEFDTDKKVYIHIKDKDQLFVGSFANSAYRLATQSDINKFFKGTKKRKPDLTKWHINKEGHWQKNSGGKTHYRTN